ncbi:MAG: response regulator, partial [Anaerolineae bacterium]
MTEQVIRVMIVDDHDMIRSGLSVFLEAFDDLLLVGEAAGGREALALCEEVRPDVVLMDLVMPGMDGITTMHALGESHPEVRVIALTSFTDEEMVQQALQAGAIGYLLKNASIDELANAIRAARDGKPTLAPEAFRSLAQGPQDKPLKPVYDLTPREHDVLALIVKGLSND